MDQMKERLRDAYNNIEFCASKTWINSPNAYQQANQKLFASENVIQEALHSDRNYPRTVRDVIPESRLAQYGNYKYNEERELLYKPHSQSITIYCPCSYKREIMREPWMTPKIEQVFVYYSYNPEFDVLELLHLDDFKDQVHSNCKPPCCLYNFYHKHQNSCDSVQASPGKKRYTTSTSLSEKDIEMHKPIELKVETFEEMIMRIKIRSEKVKHLWYRYSQPKVESEIDKKNDIIKLPLGNSFFLDDVRGGEHSQNDRFLKSDWLLDEYHLKRTDFSQLQYLADSIKTLKTLFFKNENKSLSSTTIPYEEPNVDIKTPAPSTRRLYSAVLQGLGINTDKTDDSKVPEEPFSFNISSSVPVIPVENSSNTPNTIIFGNQKNLPIYTTASSLAVTQTQTCESSKGFMHVNREPFSTPNCSYNKPVPIKILNNPSNSTLYSESSSNNISGICLNSPYFVNSYSSYITPLSTNTCGSNPIYILNSQYPSNFHNHTCTNAGLSYSNNLYPNAFQSSQVPINSRIPQFNRPYPSNPMHSMWFVSQNRTPQIYSVTHHYTSQPYLYLTTPQLQTPQPSTPTPPPPPRQNQRWQYPVSYMRSQNPYHMSIPPSYPAVPQQWGLQTQQNLYHANSNQQVETNQQIESYRSKIKTKQLNTCNKKVRNKSPDDVSTSINKRRTVYDLPPNEKQFFIKAAASTSSLECRRSKHPGDYKPNDSFRVVKRSSATTFKNDSENFVSSDSDGSHTLLPVTSSPSEDLERQALEQYQNSNENLYQELERQAEEQYDEDHSENWSCPPCKTLYIGGLIILNILFY
ncbi:hypothetical protein FQR65_LT09359 [Abscondita terminalis]|nr:hypothetical protein FQR65_LT09359 [Abscondita terminalis]